MNEADKKDLENMISDGVTISTVTLSDDDKDLDSVFQVTANGNTSDAMCFVPYGISCNPPRGASVLTLNNNGSSESLVGIPSFPENRFRDLKVWEVKIGNFKTKANVHFNDDGEIVLHLDNVTPSDDYMVRFSELKAGFDQLKSDYNDLVDLFETHVHSGVTAGSVSSGPTLTPGIPSTASIDNSKIEKIRVP